MWFCECDFKVHYLSLAKETPGNWTETWSAGRRGKKAGWKWEERTIRREACKTDRTAAFGAEGWACAAGKWVVFSNSNIGNPPCFKSTDLFTFSLARRMEWA